MGLRVTLLTQNELMHVRNCESCVLIAMCEFVVTGDSFARGPIVKDAMVTPRACVALVRIYPSGDVRQLSSLFIVAILVSREVSGEGVGAAGAAHVGAGLAAHAAAAVAARQLERACLGARRARARSRAQECARPVWARSAAFLLNRRFTTYRI